jgi:aspartokinase-like uncharacterized kinase
MQKHNHANLQHNLQKEIHRDILSLKVTAATKHKFVLKFRNLDDIITSQEKFQVHLLSAEQIKSLKSLDSLCPTASHLLGR